MAVGQFRICRTQIQVCPIQSRHRVITLESRYKSKRTGSHLRNLAASTTKRREGPVGITASYKITSTLNEQLRNYLLHGIGVELSDVRVINTMFLTYACQVNHQLRGRNKDVQTKQLTRVHRAALGPHVDPIVEG